MPIDPIPVITGGLGLAVLVCGFRILTRPADAQKEKGKGREEKTLADISRMWTGKREVLDFREIAKIWRNTPETGKEQAVPEYHRKEILAFHREWVQRSVVKGEKKAVIENILSLLDQHGDCPSVVQRNDKEAEKKYDRSVFDKLATVPLWRHSLDVAGNLARRMRQPIMLPDALIAGLGHDLGKIPGYQDTLYRTGDHPIVSIIALNRLPGFPSLKTREEISLAIRQHHQVKADTPLGADLKEADRETRLAEISRLTQGPLPEPAHRNGKEGVQIPKGKEGLRPESAAVEAAQEIPPAPIVREKEEEKEERRGPGSGSGFQGLDLDKLLIGLRPRINKMDKGRWSVVSTPDGLVLVQPDELWAQIKRQAGSSLYIRMADGDEGRKREVLAHVVSRLDLEKGATAADLLTKGFHTTQCLVVMENGKAMKIPLIPFRVEAFGVLPSALESIKGPVLRRMVKMVKTARYAGDA